MVNFSISLADFLWSYLHSVIQNHSESYLLSFELIFYWTLYDFSLAELLHFKQKNSFQILTPDISQTKELMKTKKKKLKQRDATFMCNRQNLRIHIFTFFFFFLSFRSRKKCEETTRLAKGTWDMWNALSEWPSSRFLSRNHTLQNPVGFFQLHRFAAQILHLKYWPSL